jgi:hypothetical protein
LAPHRMGPISRGRAMRRLRLPDDVGNGEAIHGLNPVRQVHLQPTRHARRKRRQDDLIERLTHQHVGDRLDGPFVTHLARGRRAELLERARADSRRSWASACASPSVQVACSRGCVAGTMTWKGQSPTRIRSRTALSRCAPPRVWFATTR